MIRHPSPTYERLRQYIAERMRMNPLDQPLMLKELLGHAFARQQPARARQRTGPVDPGIRGADRSRISGMDRSQ
jgi:hypothetical protein